MSSLRLTEKRNHDALFRRVALLQMLDVEKAMPQPKRVPQTRLRGDFGRKVESEPSGSRSLALAARLGSQPGGPLAEGIPHSTADGF